MSQKTSDVFRAGDITVDATLNSNESQLIFRPKQRPYNPYSGRYYSLSPAQVDDPTIRINQYAADGTFEAFGYLYDTQFNPVPAGIRISVAGGIGDPTQEPNPSLIYSYDNIHWFPMTNPTNLFQGGGCTALAYNGFIFAAGGSSTAANKLLYSANGTTWIASGSESQALFAGGCNAIATNGGLWIAGSSGAHRVISSLDGINWYASAVAGADSILTQSCNAVAWSGTQWLAGGNGNDLSGSDIIRSTDGTFWLPSNNSNTIFEKCLALAWNGTFWLAGGIPLVAGGNTIAISFDGITWTTVPVTAPGTSVTSLSVSCNALAWSGAQWVAGGEDASGNSLAYSYDGTAWFPGTNSTFIICNAVSWNGNSWAAAGFGTNSLVTSFDGVHWTPSIDGNLLLVEGGAVATNKILPNAATLQQINVTTSSAALTLIGASGETIIAFSKDGITWTPSTSAASQFTGGACLALSWNGYIWAAGFSNTDDGYTMGNSADGITWGSNATGSSLLTISCNAITNSEYLWIAGGSGLTRLIWSPDGITWAAVPTAIFDASASDRIRPGVCKAIGWSGSIWVGGSNSLTNRLAYSYDGSANWFASATGNAIFTTSCNAVAWNGLLWIAAGDASGSSVAAYSYNGINWIQITDALVNGSSSWNGIACNESTWILTGTGARSILFSYDGINWSASTGDLPPRGAAVAWNGVVWVAAGSGEPNAVYSYNASTWINSYNGDGIFPTGATTVAANRPQATAGNTRPTPTLYASTKNYVGAVTYTPLDASFNSLYPSKTLLVDDGGKRVGINLVPTSHLDIGGLTITPTLDISGTGIYVESRNTVEPSLSLVNRTSATRTARIQMFDVSSNAGWSIDDIRSNNYLQMVSWKNSNPFTVINVTPGDSGKGTVNINGLDPLGANGAALYVNGSANVGSNVMSLVGNVHVNDPNPGRSDPAALYVNGSANTNSNVLTLVGKVNINDLNAGVTNPAALYVNGSANTSNNALTLIGNVHINDSNVGRSNPAAFYINGSSNTNQVALQLDGSANLQIVNASDLYLSRINPRGTTVEIGGTNGIIISPSVNAVYPATTNITNLGTSTFYWNNLYTNTINNNGISLAIGSTNGIVINPGANAVYPATTNIANLGTSTNVWNNLYVNNINPLDLNLTIGGATGFTFGRFAASTDAGAAIQANNGQPFAIGSAYYTGNRPNYILWDGESLFPLRDLSNPVPVGGYNLGTGRYIWNNLYTSAINPNGSNVTIGGTTGLAVQKGSGGLYTAVWDGLNFFPSNSSYQAGLGTSANVWGNLYVYAINPNKTNLYIGDVGTNSLAIVTSGYGTRLISSSALSLNANTAGNGVCLNSGELLPSNADGDPSYGATNLGSAAYPFNNVYASNINATNVIATGAIRTTLAWASRVVTNNISDGDGEEVTINRNTNIAAISAAGYQTVRVDVTFVFNNFGFSGLGPIDMSVLQNNTSGMVKAFFSQSGIRVYTTISLSFIVPIDPAATNINVYSTTAVSGGSFVNGTRGSILITALT